MISTRWPSYARTRASTEGFRGSKSRFVDFDGSFSMVVVDREPFRAVLDPAGGASHAWALGGLQVSSRHGEWTVAPPESAGSLGPVEPAPVGGPS